MTNKQAKYTHASLYYYDKRYSPACGGSYLLHNNCRARSNEFRHVDI